MEVYLGEVDARRIETLTDAIYRLAEAVEENNKYYEQYRESLEGGQNGVQSPEENKQKGTGEGEQSSEKRQQSTEN